MTLPSILMSGEWSLVDISDLIFRQQDLAFFELFVEELLEKYTLPEGATSFDEMAYSCLLSDVLGLEDGRHMVDDDSIFDPLFQECNSSHFCYKEAVVWPVYLSLFSKSLFRSVGLASLSLLSIGRISLLFCACWPVGAELGLTFLLDFEDLLTD